MTELDAVCYVGTNFLRAFQAILNPCDNTLMIKDSKEKIALEVAGVDASVPAIAAIGLAEISEKERYRINTIVARVLGKQELKIGCTHLTKHEIDVGTTKSIKQKYYSVLKNRWTRKCEILEKSIQTQYQTHIHSPDRHYFEKAAQSQIYIEVRFTVGISSNLDRSIFKASNSIYGA